MKSLFLSILCLCILQSPLLAQEPADSSRLLDEVIIRAFEQNQLSSAANVAVRVISGNNADRYNKSSLVQAFNTVAGVRMEERSPGSYRINIRGSSLRSPFGVRNVKVYWNDIPVTDPGGNTYFNQFGFNNFSSIEIFKGPASSLYGAGTGGLLLMNNFQGWKEGASLEYIAGSYGLHNVLGTARFGNEQNQNIISYTHNQSNGYRVQSAMRRDNFTWQSRIKASERQQLTASVLYTDMYYETPGALNAAEFAANPKNARPAGGGFPSAVDARAAIFQKNLIAGLSSMYRISEHFSNSTVLYGAFSQVRNSAIRNYERRNEPHFGGRSSFSYTRQATGISWHTVAGAEFQQGYFNTQVSDNRGGSPDTLRTNDDVDNRLLSIFAQAGMDIGDKWFFTLGASINQNKVSIRRLSAFPVITQRRTYDNELAPRATATYKANDDLRFIASVARGFSPPTVGELLPSTGVISTELEAEEGWNYEMTVRYFLFKKKLQLEATGYYFRLQHALVQRRDVSGADFFTNAGNVNQKGVELHADYAHPFRASACFDLLQIRGAYGFQHYRYGSFVRGTEDFSDKKIPSVPSGTLSILADLQFKNGLFLHTTYYNASRIQLNDANTASAEAYRVLGARVGYKKVFSDKFQLRLYVGGDNLLDDTYSLGNDINAAGGRFYNAAAGRNFYVGLALN